MKHFVKTSLAMMAISVSGCASAPTRSSAYKGRVIEFRSGAEGFDTRTFFYEGEKEVVAFDAQFTPALAEQSIAYLRTLTHKPIGWLIITHPNPDKFNGASAFKKAGAKILSSRATAEAIPGVQAYKEYYFVQMAKMFKKGEYPQPVAVDQTFEGSMDLVLRGGERIQLRELSNPGVSSTQSVAYVESQASLFVGDLIHNQAHAWLEGGIVNGKPTPTIAGWIADLHELQSLYPARTLVYGGRGVQANLALSVQNQVRYLQASVQIVSRELKRLGPAVDFKALANQFQAAFPTYELSYMIEYGAYGLVQDLTAKK